MIAQFSFSKSPSDRHVLLELGWRDGERVARLTAPLNVIDAVAPFICLGPDEEFMRLSIALGFGVIVASLAEVPLTLTGDRSAWPDQFGALASRSELKSLN